MAAALLHIFSIQQVCDHGLVDLYVPVCLMDPVSCPSSFLDVST